MDDELKEIAGEVAEISEKVETTHVLFNNNYQDQGQRGAATMRTLLPQT